MAPRGRPRKEAACRTCKIRRVKCDEAKPECLRCTSTGRKCDGYTSLENSRLMVQLFSDPQEMRSFRYFGEKTILEITSHYDETFWQSLVLQLSHVNLGLGHLVVAIGSLHECLKSSQPYEPRGDLSSTQLSFSLQQCNKAISILAQQNLEQSSTGILMASCILLMTFEMLYNRLDLAGKQYKVAARILQAWEDKSTHTVSHSERDLVDNHLSVIINRFGNSYCDTTAGDESPCPRKTIDVDISTKDRPYVLPTVFLSLGQARSTLQEGLRYIFESQAKSAPVDPDKRLAFHSRHQTMLDDWNTRFQQFADNLAQDVSETNRRRICLLSVQHRVGKITFAASVFKDEVVYDRHIEDFKDIVAFCTNVVEIETGKKFTHKVETMSFSFDLGMLMPLYFTAWKCRDPTIRRQALRLLMDYPRREGIWLSWIAGTVANVVMDIEEYGLHVKSCRDVPTVRRIYPTLMYYNPCPVGTENRSTIYQPVITLSWQRLDVNSELMPPLHCTTIRLPPTTVAGPGLRPYWVTTSEIGYWNVHLATKQFERTTPIANQAIVFDNTSRFVRVPAEGGILPIR